MQTDWRKLPERFQFVFFAAFLFFSAFSIAASQIALGLSLIAFIVLVLTSRYQPFVHALRFFHYAVGAWVGWLILTALLCDTPLKSFVACREEWLFSVVLIGVCHCRHENSRRTLMSVLAVGVILISLYGLVQYFTGAAWFSPHQPSPAPGFGHRALGAFSGYVTFGNYFAVAAAGFLGYAAASRSHIPRRYLYLFSTTAALSGLVTFLSFSRAAIAALSCTALILLVILGRRHWKTSLIVVGILAASLVLIPGVSHRFVARFRADFGGQYEGGRVFIWRNSCQVISDNPLVGVGQGNFKDVYSSYVRPDIDPIHKVSHAHNDLLHAAAISGIPGLLTFVALWLAALSYFWVGYRRRRYKLPGEQPACLLAAWGASICFIGVSMYHGTFVDEEIRQLLMFFWAIGLSAWYNPADEPKFYSKAISS